MFVLLYYCTQVSWRFNIFIITKPLNKNVFRETCPICSKQIYTHDFIVVCGLDGQIYHSVCLNIDNSTANNIMGYKDWFCPICCNNIFPMFNCSDVLNDTGGKCCHCSKIISKHRDTVSRCLSCLNVAHTRCSKDSYCNTCFYLSNYTDDIDSCDFLNNYNSFNPYFLTMTQMTLTVTTLRVFVPSHGLQVISQKNVVFYLLH